ncbi:MAG: hypothetical protein SPL08_04940 [Pseudomonadota bacterium]|nr:hypothetical protein [Pseudomonadota bacterium]
MNNWEEWRQPWYLLIKKSEHPQIIIPLKPDVKLISVDPHEYDKHYYTLQQIDSDLLIAIDNDDVVSVERALKKDKIDVNTPYMIPSWEVPDGYTPQLQTFLHRALWEHSENVFKFLLDNGANPRIQGHCDDTVISNVFDDRRKEEDFLKFGKMLVDAGMDIKTIQQEAKYKNDQSAVKKLIKYATQKRPQLISKRKSAIRTPRNVRVKD